MQTSIQQELLATSAGKEADRILRSCVHCGFCTATCPTYQLLGDELDGPRGRIYLIKQMLEGQPVTRRTQRHLDRCLTCRSCETTCPSGVHYSRLLDIGRELAEARIPRPLGERIQRRLLRLVVPYPARFSLLLRLGRLFSGVLPSNLRAKLPQVQQGSDRPEGPREREILVLEGCAQSVATPATNDAAARVLDRLGISLVSVPEQGCCGAVSQHLGAVDEARDFMRANIDAWWPRIEAGAEAILVTASGCGVTVKEYGELLRDDPAYAPRAKRVSELARDLSEILENENLGTLGIDAAGRRIAFQSPCTLQHGQQLGGRVEAILNGLGFELQPVDDAHLCCGSAGTYSLLQPELSVRLRDNKLRNLQQGAPELILTANVGCQLHLAGAAEVPVRHWVELLDEMMG
jgi:glycolate oxidase iron-sulfur subunit